MSDQIKLNRIKKILDEKGIKQTWLADKRGKRFNIINAYACNRKQPNLGVLYCILEVLLVDYQGFNCR